MITKEIVATGSFKLTVDETRFTPEFFTEFSSFMFQMDSVEEAIEHLSDLYARGVIDNTTDFIEGYGSVKELGIRFEGTRGARSWIDNEVHLTLSDPE